jgi:hypothetical protein
MSDAGCRNSVWATYASEPLCMPALATLANEMLRDLKGCMPRIEHSKGESQIKRTIASRSCEVTTPLPAGVPRTDELACPS